MTQLTGTHREQEKVADNVSISAGTTDQEVFNRELNHEETDLALAYTSAGSGSISVSVEYSYGTDANGNDVWFTLGSASTSTNGEFTLSKPVKKARVLVSETGGTSGVTVTAWKASFAAK